MEKKKVNGVIVLLIIIIMILTMFCALFATGVISLNLNNASDIQVQSKNNEVVNTTLNMAKSNITTTETANGLINQTTETASKSEKLPVGRYYVKIEEADTKDLEGEDGGNWSVELNLFEDGVFTYELNHYISDGVLGNYYKEGDKIILNAWYNIGSDVSLKPTNGKKTLTINADGSITDSEITRKMLLDKGVTNVKMNPVGDAIEDTYENGFRGRLLSVHRQFMEDQTIELAEPNM